MYSNITLQKSYLNRLVNKKQTILILLKNGIKLSATLMGVSENALFLRNCKDEIIYKSAIREIVPLIVN